MSPGPSGQSDLMADFGPFSVQASQVAALGGANFGQFVNRLLDAETASHGMTGTTLATTYKENVGDGGVDAGLRQAATTKWIPSGDSAWQFKAGNLAPAACMAEIEGAPAALAILQAGGKYRLVLGVSLTTAKIASRKQAIEEKLIELGMAFQPDTVEVLTADHLARWVEGFPSLAVSPLLAGVDRPGVTFEEWSRSIRHTTTWVSSAERDQQIVELQNIILGGDQIDVHLDGVSGLGKTRLIMEAARGQSFEPIVVYAPSADQFPVAYLNQLQAQGRAAVIVIDECDSKQHEIYASVLQTGTALRLITIGEHGGVSTRSPMLGLEPLKDEAMTELLRRNEPNLWNEAIRVIVEVAAGNVDYALKAAKALLADGSSSAGSLVTADDIRRFITDKLPDGALFLACCALALFSRFGYEREVAEELSAISTGLSIPEADLRSAAESLTNAGLLTKQGRFRSVSPHPVAVYLAARGWEAFGERILTGLVPMLSEDLVERLFRRAADIGDPEATWAALDPMLSGDGRLGSLVALADGNNSKLMTYLAVMAPERVADRLVELIESASDDEIRSIQGARRNLVWTLEKLAWHSAIFETAADALLRLALVETESYSNNASGTWTEFFGAMLPGTAASPAARTAYLEEKTASTDPRVRLLAVGAAAQGLNVHETIMVSGELQGGAVVEPRGRPATWGEVWAYRNASLDMLGALAADGDQSVADEAVKVLVSSIHSVLEVDPVRDHLGLVLAGLTATQLRLVRAEAIGLESLFNRVDDAGPRLHGLKKLKKRLPREAAEDRLWTLTRGRAWDRLEGGLDLDLVAAARAIAGTEPIEALFGLLNEGSVPAAFDVGRAIAGLGSHISSEQDRIAAQLEGSNPEAVLGYLHWMTEHGESDAFDTFVDGQPLSFLSKLRLTVSGPRTDRAVARVDELLVDVPVSEAARVLFGWARELDETRVAAFVQGWTDRISSQNDFNAVVSFVSLQLHDRTDTPARLLPVITRLIALRREYPAVGQQAWDWAQLAKRELVGNPADLALIMADLVESDALSIYDGSEELAVFREAIRAGGEPVWLNIMERVRGGSWRLSFSFRAWLASAVDLDAAQAWVGGSVEYARILASVASVGDTSISDVGAYLLNDFGTDERVSASLVGDFLSGMWTGNESDRIASQINQVRGWIETPGQSVSVKRWARKLQRSLETRLMHVLEEEQEEDWH